MSFCDTVVAIASSIHSFGSVSSNYGSLVAAIIVAGMLFIIRELSIRSKNYSGVFYTMSTVESSSYNPYKGMQLFHTLVLYSDGYVICGTSEKTGDIDSKRGCEYEGAQKIRGEVTGRVERNYLWSTVMNLHIVEQGEKRESTSFMTVKVSRFNFRKAQNAGGFYSTAANTKGRVLCGRELFSEHPTGCSPFQSTAGSQLL
ncbi:hypothetical protein [Pseudomonas sp. DTU12.1]|uniref:hypothetical protein n=1 Tax=Pseudomonas sp. DTU12.1 TaxID=2654238 RepID=UPI00132E94DC|nr:hypothetical protein [Pseudomonas sp. DTU12.1]QHG24577.1 hypothetical protein GDV60_17630 [Pseudomonas sp. DTU12.1]